MNKYHALEVSASEPKYKVKPYLAISSVGTENTKKNGSMPYGAALLTDADGSASGLKSQGIN